jgi:hypothetical protein
MRMTRKTFWVRRFVPAVLLFAPLALALAAATAQANSPAASISFSGGGHLVSTPTPGSVKLTLNYDCVPPSPGSASVSIDEEGTAFGGTTFTPTCDDKGHSVTVTVEGVPPFFKGVAAGTAIINNGSGGASGMANQEINFK